MPNKEAAILETEMNLILKTLLKQKSKLFHEIDERVHPLLICQAGIGDLILALDTIECLAEKHGLPIDILTSKVSRDILKGNSTVRRIFYMEKCEFINDNKILSVDNFLDEYEHGLIYSVRTDIYVIKKMLFSCRPIIWLPNPYYENLRLWTRLRSKFSKNYKKKFYAQQHVASYLMEAFVGSVKRESKPQPFEIIRPSWDWVAMVESEPFIVFHCGGKDPIRKFTAKFIAEVIRGVRLNVVLVGESEDSDVLKLVSDGLEYDFINLVNKTSLLEIIYLLSECEFCIVPDSMVMHLASKLNVKIIAIMGNAMEETFGPFPKSSRNVVLSRKPDCSPCNVNICYKYFGRSCVQDILSEEVLGSIQRIYGKS